VHPRAGQRARDGERQHDRREPADEHGQPERDVVSGTDAALRLVLVEVAVAAGGDRLGVLSLRACVFQAGMPGIGAPGRLEQDGRVTMTRQSWDADRDGLPFSIDTELLAEADGLLMGRFLMSPLPGAHPALEQRLVAIALADQAGAALANARRAR
jgi:hypothetical protein